MNRNLKDMAVENAVIRLSIIWKMVARLRFITTIRAILSCRIWYGMFWIYWVEDVRDLNQTPSKYYL